MTDQPCDDPDALRSEIERMRQENLELRNENTALNVERCFRILDGNNAIAAMKTYVEGYIKTIYDCWAMYSGKSSCLEEKREAILIHIAATNEFIRTFDLGVPTGMLTDVMSALVDAKNGTKTPLFVPSKDGSSGRPLPVFETQMHLLGASIAVTCLMRGGNSEKSAVSTVSRCLNMESSTLRSFRKKVSSASRGRGAGYHVLLGAAYRENLAEIQAQVVGDGTWRQAAEGILSTLQKRK